MKDLYRMIPTRKKQAFAALCLAKYCSANKIFHFTISELIEHLLSILIYHNLSDWEDKGTKLKITGQGDPLPDSLKEIAPKDKLDKLNHLIESVVEVGIVDLYGATTDEPYKFLKECLRILEKNKISPPNVEEIFKLTKDDNEKGDGWGDPISHEEYDKILRIYRKLSHDPMRSPVRK